MRSKIRSVPFLSEFLHFHDSQSLTISGFSGRCGDSLSSTNVYSFFTLPNCYSFVLHDFRCVRVEPPTRRDHGCLLLKELTHLELPRCIAASSHRHSWTILGSCSILNTEHEAKTLKFWMYVPPCRSSVKAWACTYSLWAMKLFYYLHT